MGDKSVLEKKLKEALSVKPPEADPRELAKAEQTIVALTKERDLLAVTLEQKQSSTKESDTATSELQKTVKQLRARLAVAEASAVPYTAEEMALLKKAEAKVVASTAPSGPVLVAPVQTTPSPAPAAVTNQAASLPVPARAIRSVKDLPPGAGAMMAEAQRAFVAGDYAAAEQKYSEVLHQDENNVYVLSHLANAQRAAGHLEDCEKNVQRALAIDPDDAASLFMLGNLRLGQNKLDEALDALSHSASINPTNATTQNSLGSVLGQKGMRKPAEAALRKALQLDPAYPAAHYNLALVYALQNPPFMELARWHYKKAIDLGYPKTPDLEKLLAEKPAK
jgi:tetratricopeptide (TPR) repeat protein